MANPVFYQRPVALSRERHQQLRLAPIGQPYRFARDTNALPLAGSEFAAAARDLPIVFVRSEDDRFNAAALVGLRDDENLMVDADGQWQPQTYVPAFARRYPFILATIPGTERLSVCIDEAWPGFTRDAGEALFEPDGSDSPYLQRVLGFLQTFHAEGLRTAAFANRLGELDLLVPKAFAIRAEGQAVKTLQGLWVVDVERLQALGDAQVLELFRSGFLRWLEIHLLSLARLPSLVARLGARAVLENATGPAAAADASGSVLTGSGSDPLPAH